MGAELMQGAWSTTVPGRRPHVTTALPSGLWLPVLTIRQTFHVYTCHPPDAGVQPRILPVFGQAVGRR